MKLASYKSTRTAWRGIGNVLVRWRLRGIYSHCEIVFEPGDQVDALMPDGTSAPQAGALWCASATATDTMPAWSKRRAGHTGGVRFKRIDVTDGQWDLLPLPADPRKAALIMLAHEGALYDWQGIFGYLAWPIPHKASRYSCGEIAALSIGLADPWRFDPCVLHAAINGPTP